MNKKLIELLKITVLFLTAWAFFSCATTSVPDTSSESTSESSVQKESVNYIPDAEFTVEGFLSDVKTIARTGDYASALYEYQRISPKTKKRIGNNRDLYYFKAQLLNVTGDNDGALKQTEELLKTYPSDEKLLTFKKNIKKQKFMSLLRKELDAENQSAAIALFESLDDDLKNDFQLSLMKASLLTAENLLDEAEKECDRIEGFNPGSIEVMEIRLAITERRGDSKKKNEQLKKIVAKDPKNAQANIELAEGAAIKKNYKLAKKYYQTALSGNPKNEDALFGLAQMDYYLENDDAAKKALEKLLEINPSNAQAYSYLAKLAYADDKYKIAVNNIEKAIAIDDKNYDYYLDYGLYLRSAGRFKDAEASWTKAIAINADYFLAYAYRAGIYDEQNQFKEALADYKKVIQLNPKYYFAYESISILALHEKNFKDALYAFQTCREYNKENISYPLMITYCYYMLGNENEAKKFSESVYRRLSDKSSMDYKMLRAWHDKTGFQTFPQQIAALKNINERGKMYFYLGLFHELSGAQEAAKEFYAKVLGMNSPMFFEYRIAEWAVQ